MRFQYIFSIIFWSFYSITPSYIIWFTLEHPIVLEELNMLGVWNSYWAFVAILATSLGIYKAIERSRKFKKYLTIKNQ